MLSLLVERNKQLDQVLAQLRTTTEMIVQLRQKLVSVKSPYQDLHDAMQRHRCLMVFWRLFALGALVWTHSLISPCLVPVMSPSKTKYQILVLLPILKQLKCIYDNVVGKDVFPDMTELEGVFASLPEFICRPCKEAHWKLLRPYVPFHFTSERDVWFWDMAAVEVALRIAIQWEAPDLMHESLLPFKAKIYWHWLMLPCGSQDLSSDNNNNNSDNKSTREQEGWLLIKVANNAPWNQLGFPLSQEEWQHVHQWAFSGLRLLWQRCDLLARTAPQLLRLDPAKQPLFPFWANTQTMPEGDLPYALWLLDLPGLRANGTKFAPWTRIWDGKLDKKSRTLLCAHDKKKFRNNHHAKIRRLFKKRKREWEKVLCCKKIKIC